MLSLRPLRINSPQAKYRDSGQHQQFQKKLKSTLKTYVR